MSSDAGLGLDHLALASRRAWDQLECYGRQFGARWLGAFSNPEAQPFYFCQVGFANGTKLEFIEANPTAGSDFIRRFLHRNGPGPHHLTFKVADIEVAMRRAVDAGYQVVNVDLSKPYWKEAFLHPKESHGILVQIAQEGDSPGWDGSAALPPTDQGQSATIDRVTHLVADLDRAAQLFTTVLNMEQIGCVPDHPLGPAVDLRSGPWNLRLVSPAADGPRHWLGERNGRLLQIEMSVDHPSAIDGIIDRDGLWELPPERNLGTRVLISQRGPTPS